MRIIKLSALSTAVLAIGLFITACTDEQLIQPPVRVAQTLETDDYWARDNFDLSRIGPLLERSNNVEEFERYLNEPNGINNIDFNGDGYVDYLSVREFGDDYDDQHGLSLYYNYGDDLIQDVGSVYFYRDEPTYPGARVVVYGDDRIYGDNYYYETNWLDRTLSLVTFLFADHDLYVSPYYYDYYPPSYVVYEVVDTPIYVTRIERLYREPVFVYTTAPTYISYIDIRSPYEDRYIGQLNARLVKPTNEQAEFIANNPRKIGRLKPDRSGGPDRGVGGPEPGEPDRPAQPARPEPPGRVDRPERSAEPARPDRPERPAAEPRRERPAAPARERPARPAARLERPSRPAARPERPAPRRETPAPARPERPAPRTERPAPARPERPARPQPQPRQQPARPQPQPRQQPARPARTPQAQRPATGPPQRSAPARPAPPQRPAKKGKP